ncbi:MAG: hypothetical protein EHM61_13460 [Acidobacteria bacterium]|nr:MAG: hypothetical protein EHM61_13460 [Acidobacteriota bacterium]
MRRAVGLMSLVVGFMCIQTAFSQAGDADPRAEEILSRMTLEEKIAYIGGTGYSIRAVSRLGLPEIIMSDGPLGVRNYGATTAYPAGIALAATWNTELAGRMGTALGRDARARGVHILLGPGLNIYRSPLCGRNFEYFGEDPYLASRMVIPWVKGVQGQGVLATVKHYACNNQEYDRYTVSSDVDERTLREIYLPAFRAGVEEAQVACVMSSYNLINGTYSTEHQYLNNVILKSEWGFKGFLMSDWGATHQAIDAARGGLDLEMPYGDHFNVAGLGPAVQSGAVSEAVIDDKVRRILRTIISLGFLDREQKDTSIPLDDPTSAATALDVAREGIVLLKNQASFLPLRPEQLKSILILGAGADPGVPAGGGSSYTTPVRTVSLLQGLRDLVPAATNVKHLADPYAITINFSHVDDAGLAQQGFQAEYFPNRTLSGQPSLRRNDEQIAFDWAAAAPAAGLPADSFSARWTADFSVAQAGPFRFTTRSDDGMRVYLDGTLVVDDWLDHSVRPVWRDVNLDAGRSYSLKVEYYENSGSAVAQFSITAYGYQGGVLEYVDAQGKTTSGLLGEYFSNMTLSGSPVVRRTDSELDFSWGYNAPTSGIPADKFSVRWTGQVRFAESGYYRLKVRADDGVRVFLDGVRVIEDWSDHPARSATIERWFEAGVPHQLRVEYYENGGEAVAQLSWNRAVLPDVVRTADVVVLAAGFDSLTEGEGADRTFELPEAQDSLIARVLTVNPKTVVVLFGGGGVDMRGWVDQAPAIVHAWYPGQSGGQALAEILLGRVNPSGKIPATFERSWEDNPSYRYYYAPTGGSARYQEGLFVGYRGFDRLNRDPLFPFGHGLSYTAFEYSDLSISPVRMRPGERVSVSFLLKNAGARAGAEVVQLYVEPVRPPVERPVRELKRFQKVSLNPGESKRVTLDLDESALAYYDDAQRSWVAAPGDYRIAVGASSRDLRLEGAFMLRPPLARRKPRK